jgi:cbb3-type cytochrome oxidase maturation protein
MMEILTILIPVSLILGGIGLAAFIWAMKTRQFDDPAGDANRILVGQWDDAPKPVSAPASKD